MAENLKEIDAIVKNPAKPDFENTIAAFERAGKPFERVSAIYRVFSSTMSTDDFQKVETEMAPKLAAFNDRIVQNKELFSRIAAVYDAREASGLTPEQRSEEHTSELQSQSNLVCRLLLEKKKRKSTHQLAEWTV